MATSYFLDIIGTLDFTRFSRLHDEGDTEREESTRVAPDKRLNSKPRRLSKSLSACRGVVEVAHRLGVSDKSLYVWVSKPTPTSACAGYR